MGFCLGKRNTLKVYTSTYTNYRWMFLLLCFFVHFWGNKAPKIPLTVVTYLTYSYHPCMVYLPLLCTIKKIHQKWYVSIPVPWMLWVNPTVTKSQGPRAPETIRTAPRRHRPSRTDMQRPKPFARIACYVCPIACLYLGKKNTGSCVLSILNETNGPGERWIWWSDTGTS